MINSFSNIANSSGEFGNTARDNILKFQLDNEVGSSLSISTADEVVTISLLSKENEVLSSISFDNAADGASVASVLLNPALKVLDFTRSDNTHFYCNLTTLYDLIDTKQDTISDLETIRTGAQLGSTALQEVPSTYRKAEDQDIIDTTKQNIIDESLTTDSKTIPGAINELDAELQTKQPSIADIETIRSGAALGATALQQVPDTYRTSANQDIIDATKQNITDDSLQTDAKTIPGAINELTTGLGTKQSTINDLENIRSGAALGATALQEVPNTYRTSANQDIIDGSKQSIQEDTLTTSSKTIPGAINELDSDLDTKQATLVSGSNIKTINTYSVLGEGNIALSATDVLTATQQTAVNSGIDSEAVAKLGTVKANAEPNLFAAKTDIGDNSSIIYNSTTDHLQLPDNWITYLKQQTLEIPIIILSHSSSTTKVEYGVSINDSLSHSETNINSIEGKLTLYKNDVAEVSDIAPSATSVKISDVALKITSTVTYNMKCTDILGNQRTSNSISFSCYKPCFYGATTADVLSSVDGFTKKAQETLGSFSIDTIDNQYVYFVVVGTISNITSGGFAVPFDKQASKINVTLNDETLSYNVYRTSNCLGAGSNSFVVS